MSAASQGAKRPIFDPELTRSDALLLGGPPVLGVSFMRGEVPVFSQARKAFFPTACSTRVASTLRCCEHGGVGLVQLDGVVAAGWGPDAGCVNTDAFWI